MKSSRTNLIILIDNKNLNKQSTSEEVANTTVVGRTGSPAGDSGAAVASAYDVTRMREDEFEKLTVYIVPDVPCDPGTPNRAERTLPRSLTLRPSAVLSTPNTPVSYPPLSHHIFILTFAMRTCKDQVMSFL